jgi:hypothetical protein
MTAISTFKICRVPVFEVSFWLLVVEIAKVLIHLKTIIGANNLSVVAQNIVLGYSIIATSDPECNNLAKMVSGFWQVK